MGAWGGGGRGDNNKSARSSLVAHQAHQAGAYMYSLKKKEKKSQVSVAV